MQDKYCGDAVCTPAIRILEEMGVLQELVAHNEANFADSGGFVSPSGLSYIGALLFKSACLKWSACQRVEACPCAGLELRVLSAVRGRRAFLEWSHSRTLFPDRRVLS